MVDHYTGPFIRRMTRSISRYRLESGAGASASSAFVGLKLGRLVALGGPLVILKVDTEFEPLQLPTFPAPSPSTSNPPTPNGLIQQLANKMKSSS